MTTETTTFASTNLDTGAYDPETGKLTITFQNGRSYDYSGVPPEKWEGLKTAVSPGRYFNEFIKGQHDA